jgi:ribonuclease G
MSKEIYISSTPHETRLAIVENEALTEIYYERENEYTLAGSIYNGRVTRVLPGMQSSFVDIGLDRDAFLYITDFMEEAGDAADFEASANGHGGESRGGRGEGRGGGRGDRGQRAPQTIDVQAEAPVYREPSDEELFTQAVSGLEAPRSDSERGERSRRGGRNRRDRDRRPEARPDMRTDARTEARPPVRTDAPVSEGILSSPPAAEAGELGEGAPGADGSRRWRGRRGRRGNRGGGEREPRPETTVTPEAAAVRTESTGPVYNAYGEQPGDEFEAPAAIEQPERAARPERGGRGDRGDRNRGDRGPRSPRGFTPSTELYQVDGAAEVPYGTETFAEAPIEPIILPGESLSKYRPAAETPAASAPAAAPAAASEFKVEGWDGGAVLPGETIRPRSAAQSGQSDAPREFQRRDDRGGRGGRDDRSRDDRGRGGRDRSRDERGPRPESQPQRRPWQETSAPVPVAVEPQAIAPAAEPEPETASASHTVTPLHSTFVAPPPMPLVAETIAVPAVEHEYEPSEASASYRVDPVAPSEFRQAAPVIEEEVFVEEESAQEQAEQEHVFEQQAAAPEPVIARVHESELFVAPAPTEAAPTEAAPADPTHELTSILPSGEMHSEAATLVTQELVAPAPSAQGAEQSAMPVAADVAASDQTVPSGAWFAPGSGVLEEEVLEDEDEASILPHVQARYDHDAPEQETLENAADLGTMLREMSIDHLTRSEGALDEDEDFEEDFLEEDQDFGAEEGEADDSEDDASEPEYKLEDSGEELDEAPYAADAEERSPEGATVAEPGRRDDSRREGRRDNRRGDRNRRSGGDRGSDRGPDRQGGSRERGRSEGRSEGRSDHRSHGRQSAQMTNLPAISDLLKPGQEILVQIAKEPIAKKGARITSHIALPGRFLVFMPTVNHTGVSRKIESDGERRRLKEILLSEKGDAAGGFIVRTAAAGASEDELRSDLRFLLNLWTDIKTRSESSKSPALIYHDLNLVERVLRDQVTDNFSAIWVDTEADYERILRFLQRFQPALIRRVKLYTKEIPLFEQFGITEEINKALRSKVWLKSGGSIVINQTEALVAIDINTGKFVGKTARLEDTIVKTNLDAIPEIVRQIRLRDLGGIIIIDFIDMDERKNRNKVMAALEEELKNDRAPSKVLPFNDFGLVAITRKRVKQSLERTLSTTCNVCQGTGMVKSPVTVCNDIYIEMRKMQKHLDRGDVMLRVHPEVVKQLKSGTSRWLQEMEEMVGKTILVKSDPSLHPEQFDLH